MHHFFRRNEISTIKKIVAEFRMSDDFPTLEPWAVCHLLRGIVFKRGRREQNSLLVKREDIGAWQLRHPRDIARYREEGQELFYLGETWVTAGLESAGQSNCNFIVLRLLMLSDDGSLAAVGNGPTPSRDAHRQRGQISCGLPLRISR